MCYVVKESALIRPIEADVGKGLVKEEDPELPARGEGKEVGRMSPFELTMLEQQPRLFFFRVRIRRPFELRKDARCVREAEEETGKEIERKWQQNHNVGKGFDIALCCLFFFSSALHP